MGTSFSCDRCGAGMGRTADALLSANLGPGVEAMKLRGPEREVRADLCRNCFLALREWLSPRAPAPALPLSGERKTP